MGTAEHIDWPSKWSEGPPLVETSTTQAVPVVVLPTPLAVVSSSLTFVFPLPSVLYIMLFGRLLVTCDRAVTPTTM